MGIHHMGSDRTSSWTRIVLGSSDRVSGLALNALAMRGAANGSARNLPFKRRFVIRIRYRTSDPAGVTAGRTFGNGGGVK